MGLKESSCLAGAATPRGGHGGARYGDRHGQPGAQAALGKLVTYACWRLKKAASNLVHGAEAINEDDDRNFNLISSRLNLLSDVDRSSCEVLACVCAAAWHDLANLERGRTFVQACRSALLFNGKVAMLARLHAGSRRRPVGRQCDHVPGRHGLAACFQVPVEQVRHLDSAGGSNYYGGLDRRAAGVDAQVPRRPETLR